jgi:hypothetical protein
MASRIPGHATCRRGDRTTKLAAANPSGGGLCYGPMTRPLFTTQLPIAKQLFAARALVFPQEWQLVNSDEISAARKIGIAGE